jgi:hypothetical protein
MPEYFLQVRQILFQISYFAFWLVCGALLVGHGDWIPGFILGILGSVFYFLLMAYQVKRAATFAVPKAISYIRMSWLVRLCVVVVVVLLALHGKKVNFVAALVGLFSLQIVIMLNAILVMAKSFIHRSGNTRGRKE